MKIYLQYRRGIITAAILDLFQIPLIMTEVLCDSLRLKLQKLMEGQFRVDIYNNVQSLFKENKFLYLFCGFLLNSSFE